MGSFADPKIDAPISRSHVRGARTVAGVEFAKGVVGVLAILGFLSLLHKDAWDITERVLEFLRIDTDRHFAQVLLDLADRVTDRNLWAAALVATIYSTLRFIESYGLWKVRAWAEWLAAISGMAYLPFEIYESARKPTPLAFTVLVINVVIVLYMLYLRTFGRSQEASAYQIGD
jgi:uncharacterized membrane protein (DUF2068 family)